MCKVILCPCAQRRCTLRCMKSN